mgnify:CR=1 FL=1
MDLETYLMTKNYDVHKKVLGYNNNTSISAETDYTSNE